MSVRARVRRAFRANFGGEPALLARAPGRVNLIGEHTDYNDGFVMPMAIDREVCIALRARRDRRVVVHSLEFEETCAFELAAFAHDGHSWIEYVKGVARVLSDEAEDLSGWEGVLSGDVPRGAGLSSSAALELAAMRAFAGVSGLSWRAREAAMLGQRVENEWIGVNSGIMDQMIVALATKNHALLIDCRTLATEEVSLPSESAVIVLDTDTRRGLVDSAYNERRRQCEAAAAALGVAALRDANMAALEAARHHLAELAFRRARHVITENERTLQAAGALRSADLARVGQLMNASHASLRDDFEVTNSALDRMATLAQEHDACYGARMTGAGFGGCAVALVVREDVERFIADVIQGYNASAGGAARAYACQAADGASLETLNESVNQ